MKNADNVVRYIDSMSWAVSTLTGCSFGDVSPLTLNEILLSLATFLIGTILLAKIFSDFASLKNLLEAENVQ